MNIFFLIPFGIIIILWIWIQRKFFYMQWKIGGPFGLPFIGNTLDFLTVKRAQHFFEEIWKNYGTIVFASIGPYPFILLTEPSIIEEIYNSDKMLEKLKFYNPIKKCIGDGLLTSKSNLLIKFGIPDEKWMHNRKIINKAFTHKVLIDFFPIFNSQGRKLTNEVLTKYFGKGENTIFHDLSVLTLTTALRTTMGEEIAAHESKEDKTIINIFPIFLEILSKRVYNPIFNIMFPVLPIKKRFDKMVATMLNHIDDKTKKRFKILSKKNTNKVDKTFRNDIQEVEDLGITKSKTIFIDQIYESYKNVDLQWDDVTAEVPTAIITAFETSARALHIALVLLAMHSEHQDTFYKEIMSVCPEYDDDVTYEHIRQMPFTEMIIKEALRIFPVVPLVGRKATADITLKSGLYIAKGTDVVVDLFHLHRDLKIWGPKATEFNPDNFLKENISKKHAYSYIPFTKGIRNCIGWRYGMFLVHILLVHIIRKYEVKTSWKLNDLKYAMSISSYFEKEPSLEFCYRNKN